MGATHHFTIIGAGLVGALQALYLAKKGHTVSVYERRADIRKANLYQGRSINLAMSNRGWRALKNVGIDADIREIAIPMYKRTMHDMQGNLTYQPYGKAGEAIYSVSRGDLNKRLIELADAFENAQFHFEHRCTELDLQKRNVHFSVGEAHTPAHASYDYLIGTDGAFSAVRHRLMFNDRFDFSQHYIEHGYKEFTIEPNEDGTHQLEKNTLHIWPRKDFMMIALPNVDGSFTCTLFFPFEGEVSFEAIRTERDVVSFFQYYFPDLIPLIPDVVAQYMQNPTSSLVTVKCAPWHYGNEVVLMGDAAHAIVPFYGQGMNAGFEDCTVLNAMLDEAHGNMEGLFERFGKSRKPNADAVAELAMRNFIEMRDLTGDPQFLLRKKIEARFADKHPGLWTPLYSMVTFEEFPYEVALREGQRQDVIMEQVMHLPNIEARWQDDDVDALILELSQTHQQQV